MLGGISTGVYSSVDAADRMIQRAAHLIEPVPDAVEMYDAIYRNVYQDMYDALRPFNHRLFDMFTGSELTN
jgi:hypothetical protein